jgi:3-oxoacyl-[acyl-carrier protein] reductase
MDYGLSGRTALVMASTAGLGLAAAQSLAREGANVVISGRRTDGDVPSAPNVLAVRADLTTDEGRTAVLDAARTTFGPVDILVLNSGGPPPGTAHALTREALLDPMQQLLLAHIDMVQATLPGMRARGWGRIVAIGSSGVLEPIPGLALSNTVRASLAGYLKTLAAEVAADGVTTNMVLPGRIATQRVRDLDRLAAERLEQTVDEIEAQAVATIPAGRYGTAAEFGEVVAFLCSTAAGYVTGTQVRVDGGMARSW